MSGTVGASFLSSVENWGRRAIAALTSNNESDGFAGCGFVGDQWADPDAGLDAGVDADADAGSYCDNYPGEFTLNSPTDSATDVSLSPTLQWQISVDPDTGDVVTYRVLVDEDASFGSPLQYNDITGNQHTLPDTLFNEQTYYWQVFARDLCDQETASTVFSFTTMADCVTPPGAFSLVDPIDGASDESVTPTFDWADSIDPDAGDSVTYTLQIDTDAGFSSPVEFTGISESTYALGLPDALDSSQTYYWRVIANDGCSNEVNSTETFSFTTESGCIPGSISETDFVNGAYSDTDVSTLPGTLMIDRNWAVRWSAAEGILPNVDTPAWTWEAPSGGISALVNDPITGEASVHMDSTGVDDLLRYTRTALGLVNGTGSAFQIRARIVQSTGTDGFGCTVELYDGSRKLRFGMDESRILETYTNEFFTMDTTTASHTFRLGLRFGSFSVSQDETFAFDQGVGTIGFDTPNQIFWGNSTAAPGVNCEMYVNHFYYYDGGDMVPFLTPGNYESEVYDLGTSSNNLGAGATISFTATTPAPTSVDFETRSGDTAIPDGTWSAWAPLSGSLIQSSAARYLQIRAILSTGDPSVSPQLDDYTANYCTY